MKRFLSIIIVWMLCLASYAQEPAGKKLPRVIIHNDSVLLRTFTTGHLTFICDSDTLTQPILLRHRGATSLRYDKPSLAIKMVDSIGNKVDVSFLGMRKDNYWILDAMASDPARMRNRAAMDLWREIAPPLWYAAQEPEARNGYDGRMVEVWFDSIPMGLYCLMERIDRKQLKLKKYNADKGIRGMLYKTNKWTNATEFRIIVALPTDTMTEWEGWEISYPDYEDGERISWEPLIALADIAYKSKSAMFVDSIAYYIDMPTYINYCLLINLLSARDNICKNTYWSFYDTQKSCKSAISLWDMDHSWGRTYNGLEEGTEYMLPTSLLYNRFRNYYPHFVDSIESRYAALRTTFFTIYHLDSLLDNYFTCFAETGIDTLEEALWSGHNDLVLDIMSEREYIHNWLLLRLDFLDRYYHYDPIKSSLPNGQPEQQDERKGVYDIYGRYLSDRLYNLPNGLYLFRHDGIVEKVRINN